MKKLWSLIRKEIMMLLGYKYVYNTRTDEVHRIGTKHVNCHHHLIKKDNRVFLTEKGKDNAFANGADGCRWCYKEKNTG